MPFHWGQFVPSSSIYRLADNKSILSAFWYKVIKKNTLNIRNFTHINIIHLFLMIWNIWNIYIFFGVNCIFKTEEERKTFPIIIGIKYYVNFWLERVNLEENSFILSQLSLSWPFSSTYFLHHWMWQISRLGMLIFILIIQISRVGSIWTRQIQPTR